ncbi:MAG: tRNA (guanine(46)-N(7))-methyltransferase TrmB [Lentisphaeria bacterium]
MLNIVTCELQTYENLFDGHEGLVELDMGCGKGGFTIALAQRYPDRKIIGADIMIGRLRKIHNRLRDHYPNVKNVQLLRAQAVELIGFQLPRFSIDRLHILCPDPWPKSRHRAKRLLCSEFFGRLANVIKPGGVLHISTDDVPYLEFILEAIKGCRYFEEDKSAIEDIADIKTDFEIHWAKQGKPTTHLAYRRNQILI